jgi:hypothetical protein
MSGKANILNGKYFFFCKSDFKLLSQMKETSINTIFQVQNFG